MALPRKPRRVLVALALFLLALELALRLFVHFDGDVPPTMDASLEKEWEWALDHLALGQSTIDSDQVYDPLLGWRMKPHLDTGELSTNSIGMRGRDEYPVERAPGRSRLLIVGDSYAFGQHVADAETFPYFLETWELPGWEVLNMAVRGYGVDQQVLMWEHSGRAYQPDIVLLAFFVRDFGRNLLGFRSYAKPRFVPDGEGLVLVGSPVIAPEELYEAYVRGDRVIGAGQRSYLVQVVRRALREKLGGAVYEGSEGWQILTRLMQRFADDVVAHGARPVWVVIPMRDSVDGSDSEFALLEDLCAERAAELGMPMLSLSEAFLSHAMESPDVPLYFDRGGQGGHLTPAGHRLAALEIRLLLEREGLLRR